MRIVFVVIMVLVGTHSLQAQYWFGPTVGFHLADHNYLSSTYDKDSFNIQPNLNFHAGLSIAYTASQTYTVYGEILYERIGKKVTNVPGITPFTDSRSQYHFLSIPIMLRVNFRFGNAPFSMYAGGGTKISYWLGGNGSINLDELTEPFTPDELPLEYKIVYRQRNATADDQYAMTKANRIQYALQLGAGMNFDIVNESRIFLDFRFTFGHSNMGFNGSPDFSRWQLYYENFEYRHHIYSLSIGYILEYNAQLARKGKSTIKESNR